MSLTCFHQVLQYLAHDGYVETAKAFSDEVRSEKQALNIGNKEEVKGFEFHDDGDASQRQGQPHPHTHPAIPPLTPPQ